jgi:hypothetical protein
MNIRDTWHVEHWDYQRDRYLSDRGIYASVYGPAERYVLVWYGREPVCIAPGRSL